MLKLTIEVDNRVITRSLDADSYQELKHNLQNVLTQERSWISLFKTNHGTVILSSDHLRRAFIKFEEVPCE